MRTTTVQNIRELVLKQLPVLIRKDEKVRAYIIHLIEDTSAPKKKTEDRIERMLEELRIAREEWNKKWEENRKKWEENQKKSEAWELKWEENQKKWEENRKKSEDWELKWEESRKKSEDWELKWEESRKKSEAWELKWEENQKEIRAILARMDKMDYRYNQGIGAIGERWGFHAEGTFRNAIAGILSEISEYKAEHFEEKDVSGDVFGYPENIEIDLIVKNGKTFLAEIKASVSPDEIWVFKKKADWWEKQKMKKPDGLVIISPMIHPKARKVAERFGIRCFSYAEEVSL